jgi:hypothetical protein
MKSFSNSIKDINLIFLLWDFRMELFAWFGSVGFISPFISSPASVLLSSVSLDSESDNLTGSGMMSLCLLMK